MTIAEVISAVPRFSAESRPRYVRPPQPIFYPAHEEMPETNRHLELRTALYLMLKREFAERATIGSDQVLYWEAGNTKKRLAPTPS